LSKNFNHPGRLGIAISEAVEMAAKNEDIKYSLGSVLDSVRFESNRKRGT